MGGGGGLLGGVTNAIFGGQDDSGTKQLGGVANTAAGAAANIQNQLSPLAQGQQEFGGLLLNQALGATPSFAAQQMKAATDRQLAQQLGAMQSNRSVNPALAQRAYLQSAGQQQQQTAQNAGIASLQEQLLRQNQFSDYLKNLYGAQNGALTAATGAGQQYAGALQSQQNRNDSLSQQLLGAAGSGIAAGAKMFGGPSSAATLGGPMAGGAGDAMAMSPAMMLAAHGGEVPSSGPRSIIGKHFHNMQSGGHVPGKASVDGDSYKNDTVPAMLSPGEVVIPRSVMQSDDAPKKAAKFVAAVLAKKGKK